MTILNKEEEKVQNYFLSALLFLCAVVVFFLFRPYLPSVLLAFVLAIIFRPFFLDILRRTGQRETISSILATIFIIIVILIPIAIFSWLIIQQLSSALNGGALLHFNSANLPPIVQRLN